MKTGKMLFSLMMTLSLTLLISSLSLQQNHTAAAQQTVGTIAYIDNLQAIRAIEPDGSNDRLLWQIENPQPEIKSITNLDWSPNADRVAFASSHETICSRYRSDIYSISPDGSNLQRLTNGPGCPALDDYPQGSVTVRLTNTLLDESIYLVYVDGALSTQTVTISPGTTKDVTIPNVADLGDGVQQFVTVILSQRDSFVGPLTHADVIPGQDVFAGELEISNANKITGYGAYTPNWHPDGSHIAYALGEIGIYQVSATPSILSANPSLFPEGQNPFASAAYYSPDGAQVLLFSYPTISLATVGDPDSVTPIVEVQNDLYGLDWLHDSSGFIFAETGESVLTDDGKFQPEQANIYAFDIASQQFTNITGFTNEFAFHPNLSPDGESIVYAYQATFDSNTELHIINTDGTGDRSLGVSGLWPHWSPQDVQIPSSTPTATAVSPTSTPTPEATSQPDPTPDPATLTNRIYLPNVVR